MAVRHPLSTGDPLHFAQLMDHAWRAFRELLGELAELERRWRDEVGGQRWAAFREVLAQIGGDAAAGPP